jgi:uncharacterized protein DUF547
MPIRKRIRAMSMAIASLAVAVLFGLGIRFAYGESPKDHLLTAVQGEPGQSEKQPTYDVSDYHRLLQTYVTAEGWVDYAGLARERAVLNRFLEQLATVSPTGYQRNSDRLAFWINSYNAFTLADALDTVYSKRHGVREVNGFFDKRKHAVAGEQLTLDEIEKRGRDLRDPRIHFAIVCASTSCPKLQRFAYSGEKLDSQLEQAAREFLADPNRGLRYDEGRNDLRVSPIFKWYAGDFTGSEGSLWARAKATVSGSELLDFIAPYAPAAVAAQIREHPPTLHYLEYDWSLNSLDTHAAGRKP